MVKGLPVVDRGFCVRVEQRPNKADSPVTRVETEAEMSVVSGTGGFCHHKLQ